MVATAMREFDDVASGFAACLLSGTPFPFVVRSSTDFHAATLEAVRASMRLEQVVTGYRDDDGYVDHVKQTGREALAGWDDGVEAGRREASGEAAAERERRVAAGEAAEPPPVQAFNGASRAWQLFSSS
jgi:hypothetical protein